MQGARTNEAAKPFLHDDDVMIAEHRWEEERGLDATDTYPHSRPVSPASRSSTTSSLQSSVAPRKNSVTETDEDDILFDDAENEQAAKAEGDALLPEAEQEEVSTDTGAAKNAHSIEQSQTLSNFLRIYTYASRNDKIILLAASFASICTGVTLPLMNVVFGELVGAFNAFYTPESGSTAATFITTINKNVLYIVYLFFGRLILDYIATLGFRTTSIRISSSMRLAYLHALFAQPISVLDTLPTGQTASIITVTASILQIGISERLAVLLQSITSVLTALIVASYFDFKLTLVTSCGLLFILGTYCITIPKLVKGLERVQEADRLASGVAGEVFSAMRMVAACGAETKVAKLYSGWVAESRKRGVQMSPIVAIQQAPVFFAIHATFALSFFCAIKLYLASDINSVSTIIIILMSIMTIVMTIGGVASPLTGASHAAAAAGILFSIIDAPQPKTGGLLAPEISVQQDIVLDNVNFAYPTRHEVKVLDNLSLRFPAGKVTAIVGASGSGKSTIVGLLERWYELDGNLTDNAMTLFFRNGTIKVGDVNLHDIDLPWWRSQIGLVQQEPFLFNDTIFKNVEYGLLGTEWEHDAPANKMALVKQACVEAFADEFISRLPSGYQTFVGNSGMLLSGGQRQRLAIARSIIAKPSILILDEATSSIDVRGERIVQAALDKVSRGRTTITIAHRLSTVMKADNIVVIDKGRVVQQGKHEDLMADKEGTYWRLASAQVLLAGDGDEMEKFGLPEPEEEGDVETEDEKLLYDSESDEFQQEDPLDEPKGKLSNFVSFLWEQRPQWRWYSLMFCGAVGAGLSFPVQAFLFAKLISLFNLWGQILQEETSFWCVMFGILALGTGLAYFVLGWSSNTVSFNITSVYRQEYFQNVLTKPISYYDAEENSTGALTARMATDPTHLQQLLGLNMAIVLISIINIGGSIVMSLYFGWKLTILTVFTTMPIILAAGFYRIRYESRFEKMYNDVFAESSKFASESIGAFRTVTSLTLEPAICGRYEALLTNHAQKAFQQAKYSTLIFAMSDSVALLCMAFVLWYGGQLLASHEYTSFNYLVIYLAVVQGSTSAGQSLSFGPNIAQAFAAATRIREMRRSDVHSGEAFLIEDDDEEENEKSPQGAKIELRNISFQYPTRDVPVLRNLNITIERGQFAAIVGPSGCGKTSIISLLEQFYHAQSGTLLYNDADISSIPIHQYRNKLSLVAQESSLFDGTIRANVLLGVDETHVTASQLYHACRSAEIHDFIASLPEGYDTLVGSHGVALSGGQKQRIAIARALIRDPRVLLLDEATSNLDSETERAVQLVLEKAAKGRTMTIVMVAHRLATVAKADVIFVVGDGRVMESGNHATLWRKKGLYYQMCQSQALDMPS